MKTAVHSIGASRIQELPRHDSNVDSPAPKAVVLPLHHGAPAAPTPARRVTSIACPSPACKVDDLLALPRRGPQVARQEGVDHLVLLLAGHSQRQAIPAPVHPVNGDGAKLRIPVTLVRQRVLEALR